MNSKIMLPLAILLLSSCILACVHADGTSADVGPFTGKAGDGENGNIRAEYYTYAFGKFTPAIYIYLEGAPPVEGSVIITTSPAQLLEPVKLSSQFAIYLKQPLNMAESPYHLMVSVFGRGDLIAECDITIHDRYNTISFNSNGGSGSMDPVEMPSGDYTLPACTFKPPEGKAFHGWSVGGKVYRVGDTISISSDTMVHAEWKESDDSTYQVRVSVSPFKGGTATGAGAYRNGETAMLQATANSGYYFSGWVLNGRIVSVDSTYSFEVRSDADFTATFESSQSATNVFSVRYDPNGGYDAPEMQIKRSNSAQTNFVLSQAIPSHDSKSFKGWSKSPDGPVSLYPGDMLTVNTSNPRITLYAIWGEKSAPSAIELYYSTVNIPVGSSLILPVKVIPADSSYGRLIWSSSDESVVSVSSDGTITALKEGVAIITVMTPDGGVQAQCRVVVTSTGSVSGTIPTDGNGSVEETLVDDGDGGLTYVNPIVINVGESGRITFDQERIAMEIAGRLIASGIGPHFVICTSGTDLEIPWSVASVASDNQGSLTVVEGRVSMIFSDDVLRDMNIPYTGMTICVVPMEIENVSVDVSMLSNCTIYDIYVLINGARVAVVFTNPVIITVDHDMQDGWTPDGLYVYHLDPDPMQKVDFEFFTDRGVVFGVHHFSLYAIGHEGAGGWFFWIPLALILVCSALLLIFFVWRRRRKNPMICIR